MYPIKNWCNENLMRQKFGTKETWVWDQHVYSWIPHDIYQQVWEAAVGETIVCSREARNSHEQYAVVWCGTVIGHLLKSVTSLSEIWVKNSVKLKAFIQQRYLAGLFTATSISCSKSFTLGGTVADITHEYCWTPTSPYMTQCFGP